MAQTTGIGFLGLFALKSHVGISAFRLRVQGKERFCTTSLSRSYWSTASSGSGSPPRPTNAATSTQGSARCFSAHQTTIASLVFGGEHCIPSCSWRLSLVLRSLCGCRIRTVVQCWPLSVIVVSKESVNYCYSYGYHDWIELLKPDFCGKYVIIRR